MRLTYLALSAAKAGRTLTEVAVDLVLTAGPVLARPARAVVNVCTPETAQQLVRLEISTYKTLIGYPYEGL